MSIGVAQANTNYDFSTTFNGFSYTATFSSSAPGILDGLVGSSYGGWTIDQTFPSYPASRSGPAYGTYVGSGVGFGGAVLTGIRFDVFSPDYADFLGVGAGPIEKTTFSSNPLPTQIFTYLSLSALQPTDFTFAGQSYGVAPEMNASFIPQVALMLACLFFLFGRKKENTEPMLAA